MSCIIKQYHELTTVTSREVFLGAGLFLETGGGFLKDDKVSSSLLTSCDSVSVVFPSLVKYKTKYV